MADGAFIDLDRRRSRPFTPFDAKTLLSDAVETAHNGGL
jgi:hypothetical protein